MNLNSRPAMMQKILTRLSVVLALSAWAGFTLAIEPVSTGRPVAGVAAGGHDVTAYRSLKPTGSAVAGSKTFPATWKEAQWHFATRADRDRFVAAPESFAPAFNGFCANALSIGEGLVRTDGTVWAIFDKQLYFFYAARGAQRWKSGDYRAYRQDATAAWQSILKDR